MKRLRTFISILLLSLFATYQINISLFIHSHIIEGVKTIHSHPYNAPHSHSTAELVLIGQLSNFHSLEAYGFCFDFSIPTCYTIPRAEHAHRVISFLLADHPSLRAPPCLKLV